MRAGKTDASSCEEITRVTDLASQTVHSFIWRGVADTWFVLWRNGKEIIYRPYGGGGGMCWKKTTLPLEKVTPLER